VNQTLRVIKAAATVRDELYESVQDLLSAWARWRWTGHSANIGYPSQSAFMREARTAGNATLRALPMPDDLAQRVDLAVSQLKLRSEPVPGDHRWQVLTDAYLNGWTDRVIAKQRKMGRSTVRSARIAAENWIEGRLY
jgi:hypothetical protein